MRLNVGNSLAVHLVPNSYSKNGTAPMEKSYTVSDRRVSWQGYEITESLNNLTPTMYFKVYGFGAPVDEIYDFIYTYMRDTYITDLFHPIQFGCLLH